MSLLLPIIAFSTGYALANYQPTLKVWLAQILSKILIPVVIIYNMVFYQSGSLSFMAFSFCSSAILYFLSYFLFKDKVAALCISYPNLAWLGFPIAHAIFGDWASAPMVALYIGGSLFGNVVATSALNPMQSDIISLLKKMIYSPPVIALIIAGVLRLFNVQYSDIHVIIDFIYEISKWAMTVAGMVVLGMWLRGVELNIKAFQQSLLFATTRMLIGVLLCLLTWLFFPFAQYKHYLFLMFMLFLLPPAANIVALETYYAGTGKSAKYIAAGTITSGIYLLIFYAISHYFFILI